MKAAFIKPVLRYLSQLFKSLWLFFPGILFILFAIFCFWVMGQGQDMMVAFIRNDARTFSFLNFNYTRMIFFIAVAFWAYVSWYSARIISYIKKTQQQVSLEKVTGISRAQSEARYDNKDPFFELGKGFLDAFPRMIGSCCFLVMELAVLQLPVLQSPIGSGLGWGIFFVALVGLHYLNNWLYNTQATHPMFRKIFWVLVCIFLVLLAYCCFAVMMSIWMLFFLLLLLHAIFIYYINLRHLYLQQAGSALGTITTGKSRSRLEKLMDYFCIPRREKGYYRCFLVVCNMGIAFYLIAILWLAFARGIGPFSYMVLAFGVLLAFGNFIVAFSAKYKVNFHFILLIIGLLFGLGETHYTRTINLETGNNNYASRPNLRAYLTAWLNDRMDSSSNRYDMYFVMANGGASRSGYWTAAVLGSLEDASLKDDKPGKFSDHLFCLSGTSGGGVGVATFFSMLRNNQDSMRPVFSASAKAFLKQDYFTYTVARMLGPDYFNYVFHMPFMKDRAGALEKSFEESAHETPEGAYTVPFYDPLSSFPALKNGKTFLPVLCVNTTRMQDGNPGVVTNLKLDRDIFNSRIDVVSLLKDNEDISITTAAILGARFPYLSPAGRIGDDYFVDGGYFDNSGAGTVQEMIRGIVNIGMANPALMSKISRINFKILHIVNSPVGFEPVIESVAPVKNDLMSPLITIMGAYDMQTTVNDSRLVNYMKDLRNAGRVTSYDTVSLYLTPLEKRVDTHYKPGIMEPAYAMNWFMSDSTRKRIDVRLATHPKLKSLIDSLK